MTKTFDSIIDEIMKSECADDLTAKLLIILQAATQMFEEFGNGSTQLAFIANRRDGKIQVIGNEPAEKIIPLLQKTLRNFNAGRCTTLHQYYDEKTDDSRETQSNQVRSKEHKNS